MLGVSSNKFLNKINSIKIMNLYLKKRIQLVLVGILLVNLCVASLPQQTVCGQPAIKPNIVGSSRIIGGSYAVANSFPWIVSLRVMASPTLISSHFCAGKTQFVSLKILKICFFF